MSLILNGSSGVSDVDGSASTPAIRGTDTNTGMFFPAADTIAFAEGGTESMRLDSNGNVGIGTSSPDAKLRVNGGSGSLQARFSGADNRGLAISTFTSVGTADNGVTYNAGAFSDAQHVWQCGGTERMRIGSGGEVFIGTTTTPSSSNAGIRMAQPGSNYWISYNSGTSSYTQFIFGNGNGQVGSISTSGSGTSFTTSSDYRLKENIAPMTGALAKVSQLKPVTYKWKVDGSDGEGFIAHELAEVVPDCVTGEKDAVDADGNPVYQGIDTSFLVATLTCAIQELKAELDTVKTELATLKGAA